MCRSQGDTKLCDGFACRRGAECQSGCCATFGTLKQDFCQPLVEDVCPVSGFAYGPHGDVHGDDIVGLESKLPQTSSEPAKAEKSDADKKTTETPAASEQKGVKPEELAGKFGLKKDDGNGGDSGSYKLWVLAVAAILAVTIASLVLYCCCCRKGGDSSSASVAEQQNYQTLNGSHTGH